MFGQLEKPKKTHSGSKSKSKKSKANQHSLDFRGKTATQPVQSHKLKTQHNSSLNKSKPSRKNSSNPQKKHTKSNVRDPKDPTSHSVSADRRHSFVKNNRNQGNFDQEDFQLAIDQVLLGIRKIPQPPSLNPALMGRYFSDLQKFYAGLDRPFQRLCSEIHNLYLNPLQAFLDLVAPMQEAIRRKDQIAKEIDQQIIQNQQLYSKLQPIDVQIFKLKQKIEENRILIERRKSEKHKSQQKSRKDSSAEVQMNAQPKAQGIGKGFKLDLQTVHRSGHMGYHQQFYSKLEEFSESWRDQALREKRF